MSERTSGEIERTVETKRREVEATLDALRAKLSTGQLLDSLVRALASARGQGGEVVGNLARQATMNPLAIALTGAGILLFLRGPPPARGAPAEEPAVVEGDAAPSAAAEETVERVREAAAETARSAVSAGRRARRGVANFITQEPLAAAAIGLAIGAAIGAAIPSGRRESNGTVRNAAPGAGRPDDDPA